MPCTAVSQRWRYASTTVSGCAPELGGVPSPDTWRKWVTTIEIAAGEHTVEARATDGLGTVQTADIADVAPDGASGYASVELTAE